MVAQSLPPLQVFSRECLGLLPESGKAREMGREAREVKENGSLTRAPRPTLAALHVVATPSAEYNYVYAPL